MVALDRVLGLEYHLPLAEDQRRLLAEHLVPALRGGLVVEGRAEVHREALGILEHRVDRVWHLVRALVQVVLPHRRHAGRHLRVHQEVDAGQQVHEEVGRDPARVVPVGPPAEEALQAEGPPRGRPEKGCPVDGLLVGVGRDRIEPGSAARVSVVGRPDHGDLSELAAPNDVPPCLLDLRAHALATDLEDAARRLGGGDHRRAVFDDERHGLLDVHVLAGAERLHDVRAVPMVRRRDDHRVDRRVREERLPVAVVLGPAARAGDGPLHASSVGVADAYDLDAGHGLGRFHQAGLDARAHAYDPELQAVVGGVRRGREGDGRPRQGGRGHGARRAAGQELTPAQLPAHDRTSVFTRPPPRAPRGRRPAGCRGASRSTCATGSRRARRPRRRP